MTFSQVNGMRRGLCVLTVLFVLHLISATALANVPSIARCYKAKADIAAISSALQLFKQDISRYPNTSEGLGVLVAPNPELLATGHYHTGGYLDRVPNDPWTHPYQYSEPGSHNLGYDIWSWGADGHLGGDGEATDIGNWSDDPCRQTGWRLARRLALTAAMLSTLIVVPIYLIRVVLGYWRGASLRQVFRKFGLGALLQWVSAFLLLYMLSSVLDKIT